MKKLFLFIIITFLILGCHEDQSLIPEIPSYELNVDIVPPDAGSVNIDPLRTKYNEGEIITLVANACEEYEFVNYTGDAAGDEKSLTVIINENKNLTANFTEAANTTHNIAWENWYLSVPIDAGNGKATSIQPEDIASDNFTIEESKYFYKNCDGSYTMWTKFTGFTTSGMAQLGDRYCRTELREYWRGNQDVNDNWSMSSGEHIMETTMQVNFVERHAIIVAQIHGKESPGISGNPAPVKIQWYLGELFVDHYTKPPNGEPWSYDYQEFVDMGRVDNEIFTFKIKIEDGKLFCAVICEAKGLDTEYKEIFDYVGNGYVHENYFKTGNYFLWHDDYEKASQVVLHNVVTIHN